MLIVVLSCAHGIEVPALPATPTAAESLELTPNAPETLWAVGDAATCRSHRDDAVASFLATRRGTIALLGDLAYEKGKPSEFRDCFDPLYGVLRERIRPAVGNHEYGMKGARGYFDYFAGQAGEPGEGWYSYDLNGWHIVVLNSNCEKIRGCDRDSPQYQWLARDLALHPATCTLAYWHHPRWSSGRHGSTPAMQPIWELLYAHGVELVLSGHDHHYERFLPLDAEENPDPERGIVQFVVGTGGRSLRSPRTQLPTSAVATAQADGVLELTLYSDHYTWRFHPIHGQLFEDTGSRPCH